MYNIIQADANEPVPPVITKVLSLNDSVMLFIDIVFLSFQGSKHESYDYLSSS